MVSSPRRRRRGAVIGLVTSCALAGIFGLGSLSAGARTDDAAATVSPTQYPATGALGAAAGDGALGLRTPYFDPPALSDPSTPGFTINSGHDQPDPFIFRQGARYFLFTSQDEGRRTSPCARGPRWASGETDALPDPPAWAAPGVT